MLEASVTKWTINGLMPFEYNPLFICVTEFWMHSRILDCSCKATIASKITDRRKKEVVFYYTSLINSSLICWLI